MHDRVIFEERSFGEYRAERVLARGGMGTVYQGRHVALGTRVALKVESAAGVTESHARARFTREARCLREIEHPHVVRILATELEAEPPFIVMELLEGETLQAALQREGRLSLERTLEWFLPILSAVAAIHDAGILHRDLKTGNVVLARDGSSVRPVVIDLGIARLIADDSDEMALTHSEALLGTPRYLSPEQTLNALAASPLSDQYALGVMLYECVTGARPFSGGSHYELMHAVLNAEVPPPSARVAGLPTELDAIVLRAMARDTSERFESVRAFGKALLPLASADVRAKWEADFACEALSAQMADDATEVDWRTPIRAHSLAPRPIDPARGGSRTWFAVGTTALLLSGSVAMLRPALPSPSPQPPPAFVVPAPTVSVEPAAPYPPAVNPLEAAPPAAAVSASPPSVPLATQPAAPRPAKEARATTKRRAPLAVPRAATTVGKRAAPSHGLSDLGIDDAVDPFSVSAP